MPIFEIGKDSITPIATTSFSDAGLTERADLQRLLRDKIDVVVPDVLVIAEEFGEWTDSRRRIDLLGVDTEGNLVVIELKRTEEGGHMELQAVRYAAMVAQLTGDRAVEVFGKYLTSRGRTEDPRQRLLDHLGAEDLDEERFGKDVRIVLVAADFSRELTTAVMWLNERDLDIRCVRMKPYGDRGRVLVDVQQIIPLPEARDYQVQVREKRRKEREARQVSMDFTRYDVTVGGETHRSQWKRNGILHAVKVALAAGASPHDLQNLFADHGKSNAFLVLHVPTQDADEFQALAAQAARDAGRSYDERRWHTKEGDLLVSDGKTYALTNQWGGPRWSNVMQALQKRYPEIGLQFVPSVVESED